MSVNIIAGNNLESLRGMPTGFFQCCVTSPPYYGLRSYLPDGHSDKPLEIGLEPSPTEYVARMVEVFAEVRRVLRDDGTLFLNIGDTIYSGNGQPTGHDAKSPARNFSRTFYRWQDRPGAGLPKKSLVGIPWMLARALAADGWTIRSEIIWHRPGAFSQAGISDRPFTTHETIFLASKSRRYWFDKSMCSMGTVWTIPHERGVRGHSAAFPFALAERCIKAGSKPGDRVLDPFGGSGTTGMAAARLGRSATLCEINPEYARLARERITADGPLLAVVA